MVKSVMADKMTSKFPKAAGFHGDSVSLGLRPNLSKTNRSDLPSTLSNMTGSMFGGKKAKITTYSKKWPVQVVNKYHFLTPETPNVFTPDATQDKKGRT